MSDYNSRYNLPTDVQTLAGVTMVLLYSLKSTVARLAAVHGGNDALWLDLLEAELMQIPDRLQRSVVSIDNGEAIGRFSAELIQTICAEVRR